MEKEPLVSIVVITYNSSKYVLETLESAKAQTYQNIELVVSDDCSTDNTIDICQKWIKDNDARFVRTEIITVEKNTGITPNCNRGYKAAKGEWIKVIAGDDLLFPECVQECVEYVSKNDEKLIISGILPFCDNIEYSPKIPYGKWLKGNAKRQLKYLLKKGTVIAGPTFFIERLVFEKLKGFDETCAMVEDYPFAIKYTKHGYRIGCINKVLIRYRKNPDSVTLSDHNFPKSFYAFFWKEVYPEMKEQKLFLLYWHHFLSKNIVLSDLPLWLKRLTYLIDPVGLYEIVLKRIKKQPAFKTYQ